MVAKLSAEAEFKFMAHGICGLLWLNMLLSEVGFHIKGPMSLYCNNKAAISIAHDPVQHGQTKHVDVDRHFIKDHLKKGSICTPYIQTHDQHVNIFTEDLSGAQFMYIVSKLGMINIYSLA